MDTIYGLVPAMLLLALVSVAVFFWAARSGQYDDMEGPAHRILDDDDPLLPKIGPEKPAEKKPISLPVDKED